jgi:hypothetical protein
MNVALYTFFCAQRHIHTLPGNRHGQAEALPGVEPTFRRAQVLAIAVVGFDRTRIRSQRVLWDHATLLGQLGITAPAATGPAR